MKKNINKILAITFLFLLTFTVSNVNAEELPTTGKTSDDVTTTSTDSKWETMQPVYTKTSDGIEIQGVWTIDNYSRYYHWDVVYTIPADYDKESITFSPELFEELAALQRDDEGPTIVMPSDKFYMSITIVNNSKYTYNYDTGSFIVYPDSQVEYDKITEEETDSDKLFNGLEATDLNMYGRTYNTALQALIPNTNSSKLTDTVIDEALKKAGYENGIKDYSTYLLKFYNEKYRTNYTRLDDFSLGIIREILGEIDPIYNKNSAYTALGLKLNVGKATTSQIRKINDAVKAAGYDSAIDYLLAYYNKEYNDNATNLSEICDAAHDDFFQYYGIEKSPSIVETNPELIVLHYNYFYNKLVSINFDDEEIDDNNSEENSIGEYMRDETKGDEHITESIGSLTTDSTNKIENIELAFNGAYMANAYQNYEFMAHISMSYSALKGNLIVKYVDEFGNTLTEDLKFTEMVGKDYITKSKEFEGYVLSRVEGEVEGKYIDGDVVVTYIYKSTETGSIVVDEAIDSDIPNTGVKASNSIYLLLLSIALEFGLVLSRKKLLNK